MRRSVADVAAVVALAAVLACASGASRPLSAATPTGAASPGLALRDPDGRLVDPFLAAESSAAVVFLFASVDCPVSNRYAPEVRRLHATFSQQNVAFWLVYPNPTDTPDSVREHLKAFGYPVHALLDPRHDLVRLAKVAVTPEAAVFNRSHSLMYHGRIDDRFVSLGVERPAATKHDLSDALTAVLSGKAPSAPTASAVGCFIVDFVQ